MRKMKQIASVFCCLLTMGTGLKAQTPSKPFGTNTGYANGLMQTHQTAAQATQISQSWYDYWSKSFIKDCGGGKALVVNDYGGSNAYSEGQGYGMLLAAYQGDKATYDKLVKGYFDNTNNHGVMNWTVSCSNNSVAPNGATDGDLDAAMSLLIANKQWPGSTNPNYASLATTLIGNIKTHEFTDCSGKTVQKAGDWLGGCNCTNPSYYATGYYRAFAKHVPGDASFWTKAADDGLDLLLKATHPSTGLNPAWTDATGNITNGGSGDCNNIAAPGGGKRYDYQFDAARTPWRIVVDYLWWGTPKAKQYLDKITGWANTKGINQIFAGHTLDGTAYLNYTNSAFVGGFAIGAMGSTSQTTLNAFYKYWIENSMHDKNYASGKKLDDNPYFQNSLRTMYHFVASGNFWNPYATGGNENPGSVVTVSLTNPENNATVVQGSPVTITATASSTNGASITKVEFLVDGTVVNTDLTGPYTFSTTTLAAGPHTISARATDSNGKTATSTSASITVTASQAVSKVTVSLSSPANGSETAQGSPVTISAAASSTNGATITNVVFLVDGNPVNTDATAPYSYSVSTLSAGEHTIAARATDSNGNSAITASVSITVTGTTQPTSDNVDVPKPSQTPGIDGNVDEVWAKVPAVNITKVILPSVSGPADLSAFYKTMWDEQNLYVLVNVTDDVKMNDSGNEPYKDDGIEMFFDIGNDKSSTYGDNDVQYTFRWNDNTISTNPSGRSTAGIQSNMAATSTGYVLEVKIPWSAVQGAPASNQRVGFDIHVNDDDNGSDRDAKISWASESDEAWRDPSLLGVAKLTGTVAGLDNGISLQTVNIFPNPFSSSLFVSGLGTIEYSITDLAGQTVQSGTASETIDTHFESGVYYLVIKKPAGYKPVKIIKVN